MIIYEEVKKNTIVSIFSKQKDILDEVVDKLENDEFNVKKYDDIEKLKESIIEKKARIIVFLDYDLENIKHIKEHINDNFICRNCN